MSVTDLKNYGRVCGESPMLETEVRKIGLDNIEGQIKHSRSLGFEWDGDSLKALASEMEIQGELSEKDYEKIFLRKGD